MTTPPALSSTFREQTMRIRVDADAVTAQGWARRFAESCGFTTREQWEVAVAVSEAASNIVKFGAGGRVTLRFLAGERRLLEIEAVDWGPGIHDLAKAELDGVTEGRRREDGGDPRLFRGLGLGLGAIRRMTDELRIETSERGGTRLVARKRLKPSR